MADEAGRGGGRDGTGHGRRSRRGRTEPAGGTPSADATAAAAETKSEALRRRRAAALETYRAERVAAVEALRESVRASYEAGTVGLSALARSVDRTSGTLRRWARECGWSEPARRVGRAAPAMRASARQRLVGRLFAAFDHQVGQVEARAGAARADGGAPAEADIKVVAALAKTLEVLIDLDRRTQADAAAEDAQSTEAMNEATSEGADVEVVREELARRLDRLREAERG